MYIRRVQKKLILKFKMKRIYCFLITILLFISAIYPLQAQTTGGKKFWLTFGNNAGYSYNTLDLQIRIVGGDAPTSGTIEFTDLGTSIPFSVLAQQVYTYSLDNTEKQAVYNGVAGKSNRSIHITTNNPVTVYALTQHTATTDATNVLPVTALGTDYYQISYEPFYYTYYVPIPPPPTPWTGTHLDAYAVIATEDDIHISYNGAPLPVLNTGQVYYQTSSTDMTGAHITANKPVAFFAVSQGALIPRASGAVDCLMQQLDPVNTWGKNFFVPVSHLTHDRVRIVASENNTNITQVGGTIVSATRLSQK